MLRRFVLPETIVRSQSMRLRNGLDRFSSSERSYPCGMGIAAAVFIAAHGSVYPGHDDGVIIRYDMLTHVLAFSYRTLNLFRRPGHWSLNLQTIVEEEE